MSTINCTDKSCVYQKDGKCEFNAVVSGKVAADGHCVHYSAIPQENQTHIQKNRLF